MKPKKRQDAESKARARTIILAAAVVVIIGAIAGVAIYQDRRAPFRTTVLVVDSTSIKMGYFLKRVYLSGREPLALLQTLTNEAIIKQVAPKPPYNITIDEQDIDEFLREIARGESDTITESDFKEWYRQQLNESRISGPEFRDQTGTNLLTLRLTEYLADRVPTVAEQVHLHMIPGERIDDAKKVKERLDAGEDFGKLAREMSSEEQLKQTGGDIGWFPRGALIPSLSRAVFDELGVGEVSEPLYLNEQTFAIVMVSERVAAREIDEASLQRVKAGALAEWLKNEQQYHKVQFHGFNNGYDSETNAWVTWQLQRMKR